VNFYSFSVSFSLFLSDSLSHFQQLQFSPIGDTWLYRFELKAGPLAIPLRCESNASASSPLRHGKASGERQRKKKFETERHYKDLN